jgi:serine/threonine protein kinase
MNPETSLMDYSSGGTEQWMSPELLHPERFGFTDTRPTKESDCYAFGMVIYEVRRHLIAGGLPR